MAKTYSVFGDSISTFKGLIPEENHWYYDPDDTNGCGISNAHDTWWMKVIDALDGELLSNASFSGSMVQGCGFPAACDPQRAAQLLSDDMRAPDNVLVFIGINDYGWGSPEAQLAGGSQAAPRCAALPSKLQEEAGFDADREAVTAADSIIAVDSAQVDPAGDADADAATRFGKAYEQMLRNIKEVAPFAHIWCITLLPGRVADNPRSTFCYRLRGIDIDEYNLAIHDAAESVDARVADVYALGYDYDAIDGTHPNKEGMVQLASLVYAAICKELGDDASMEAIMSEYPERLRSARFCSKPTCVGCEFSDIGPDHWSCVCAGQL